MPKPSGVSVKMGATAWFNHLPYTKGKLMAQRFAALFLASANTKSTGW